MNVGELHSEVSGESGIEYHVLVAHMSELGEGMGIAPEQAIAQNLAAMVERVAMGNELLHQQNELLLRICQRADIQIQTLAAIAFRIGVKVPPISS